MPASPRVPPVSPGGLLALVARQQLDDLLADAVEIGTELDQNLGCYALTLTDETEQDVLGTDVVVSELQRLAQTQLENLLGARCEGDVTGRSLLALADDLLDLAADSLEGDTQRLQRLGCNTFALVNEAEKDVLRADVVVVEHPGFFLSQDNNAPRAIGEPLEHRSPSHSPAGRFETGCLVPGRRVSLRHYRLIASPVSGLTSTNRQRLHDPTYYSRGREVHLLLLHPIGGGSRTAYRSQRRS